MITLAPEVVEEKIIKLILDNDIVISIGHSELSYKNTIEYIYKLWNILNLKSITLNFIFFQMIQVI